VLTPESPPVLGKVPGAVVVAVAAAVVAAVVAAAVAAAVAAVVAASVAAVVAASVAVAVVWSAFAADPAAPANGTSNKLNTRMAAIAVSTATVVFRMKTSPFCLC
jgi:hypothetical protein